MVAAMDRHLLNKITQWQERNPEVSDQAVNDLYRVLDSHSTNQVANPIGPCFNCVMRKKKVRGTQGQNHW
jgi:hypothetical protein